MTYPIQAGTRPGLNRIMAAAISDPSDIARAGSSEVDWAALLLMLWLAGWSTALALHRAGIACRIYESVEELREMVVGIYLLPHAVRELTELGLQAQLRGIAVETAELCYFNKFGQLIWRAPDCFEDIVDVVSR